MTSIDWLANAREEFDSGWRAHAASMRSMQLLRNSRGLDAALQVALAMAKGFPPQFDSTDELEELRDELEWLKDKEFEPMRRNCLLGVSANFEDCMKVAAAAISFGPDWKTDIDHHARLHQDCDSESGRRFASADNDWSGNQEKFLLARFPYLQCERSLIASVIEVIWIRNQLTHNAGRARTDKRLPELRLTFERGDQIKLNQPLMASCVSALLACGRAVFNGTPYLEYL